MASTVNPGSHGIVSPAISSASVQVLGINITLPPRAYPNPSIKLRVNGRTISKQPFHRNSTQLNWVFDTAYLFQDGASLTFQLCSGRIFGSSELISTWGISFSAAQAASDSPGDRIEYEINANPRVTLILALSGNNRDHDERGGHDNELENEDGNEQFIDPWNDNPEELGDINATPLKLLKRTKLLDRLWTFGLKSLLPGNNRGDDAGDDYGDEMENGNEQIINQWNDNPEELGDTDGTNATTLDTTIELVKQNRPLLDRLGIFGKVLESLLQIGTAVSEIHPIAKAVLASVNVIYKILDDESKRNEFLLKLVEDMESMLQYVADVEQFAKLPKLVEAIGEVARLVEDTKEFVVKYCSQSELGRTLRSAVSSATSSELTHLNSRFEHFKQQFDRGVAIQSAVTSEQSATILESLIASTEEDKILAGLDPKDLKVGSRVEGCMDGTREDILKTINDWILDLEAPQNILWVKGYPGAGKSTVASSVVEHLRGSKRLGSYFFFHRGKATDQMSHAFWRSVAFDLSRRYPTVRKHLARKLEDDGDIPTIPNVDELFRQIIQEPLEDSGGILPVIVIDALDECGGLDGRHSHHRKGILRTLLTWSKLPRRLKIVVTSRDEDDIKRTLQDISHVIEIPTGVAASVQSLIDIEKFLTIRFGDIANEYTLSDHHWPEPKVIQQLAKRAGGLFIWATVIIDFIGRQEPLESLALVEAGTSGVGDMAKLYSTILEISFPKPTPRVIDAFHSTLGAIILAKEPLSTVSLERLLPLETSRLQHICKGLKSVVDSEDILRITHQSFVDFLIDGTACPSAFCINLEDEEARLALACLRTMQSSLRFNICNLESSYLLNNEVTDMDSRTDKNIPLHLRYASLYWTHHLSASRFKEETLKLVQDFVENRFLFWLEVMSVTRRMNLASHMLSLLVSWMKSNGQMDSMATDLKKFTTTFANVLSQSAPHIYISALPFVPQHSMVAGHYMHIYKGLRIEKGGLQDWPAIQNILAGHTDCVISVAFSHDGKYIASGSSDRTVRIWDAETGDVVTGPFTGHTGAVYSVAFSQDGKHVASGSHDCTVRTWDVETGDLVAGPFTGHTDPVWSVTFSQDGKHIASGSDDCTIRIWDAETGDVITGPFTHHTGGVNSVAFSQDGKRIASGSDDCTVMIWDVEIGNVVARSFTGHSDRIWSVAFSQDGKRIASGSTDHTVRIWDVEMGDVIARPFMGHTDSVLSVAFSQDGKRVASGSSDCTVRIWDTETGDVVAGPFTGHTDTVRSVAFSNDGKRVASGSIDRTVRIWDAENGDVVPEPFNGHTGKVQSVAFSQDGKRIASGSDDCTIRIWDAETGDVAAGPFTGHTGGVYSVTFSQDSRCVASGSGDHTVMIWDAEVGDVIAGPFTGHSGRIQSVAFSQDGKCIASGSTDYTVRIWDVEMGHMGGRPFTGHTGEVNSVAFSQDGKFVASGSNDYTVRIWDVETGDVVGGPFTGHTHWVCSVAFSQDGKRIVSGSDDHTIRIWDAETGDIAAGPFTGHTDAVRSVAFSHNGKHVASGSSDCTVRIWDAEMGDVIAGPFTGHIDRVWSVTFLQDGKHIASGSDDKTVRIWDLEGGKKMNVLFTNCWEMQNGWISSNSTRLFWVPPLLRDGLIHPNNTLIIGKMIATKLDLDALKCGEDWIVPLALMH